MPVKYRKNKLKTPMFKNEKGKCTIPGAMPAEALRNFLVDEERLERDEIRSYVEWQAPKEKVKHLEKVTSENIFGQPMDAWDVLTNKSRWWVITNPTNVSAQQSLRFSPLTAAEARA